MSSELAPKRLQLLSEVLPGLARVAVLYNPTDPNKRTEASQLEAAAKSMGLAIVHSRVRAVGEFDAAFAGPAFRRKSGPCEPATCRSTLVLSPDRAGAHGRARSVKEAL